MWLKSNQVLNFKQPRQLGKQKQNLVEMQKVLEIQRHYFFFFCKRSKVHKSYGPIALLQVITALDSEGAVRQAMRWGCRMV